MNKIAAITHNINIRPAIQIAIANVRWEMQILSSDVCKQNNKKLSLQHFQYTTNDTKFQLKCNQMLRHGKENVYKSYRMRKTVLIDRIFSY